MTVVKVNVMLVIFRIQGTNANFKMMKKVVRIFALAAFVSAVFASCTPHKQTCAAYNSVELTEVADVK